MPLSEEDQQPQGSSAAPAAGAATEVHEQSRCIACSGGILARQEVKTALWQGERLVVVSEIPALVCQSCGEQYYEDDVAMQLDLMRGGGFPAATATQVLEVPVFSFRAPKPGDTKG